MFIGKLVGDFLLVITELFSLRAFVFVTIHAFDRRTDGRTDGQTDGRTDRRTDRQNLNSNTVRICFT